MSSIVAILYKIGYKSMPWISLHLKHEDNLNLTNKFQPQICLNC